MSDNAFPGWHGTTIVSVRRGNKVVVAGDGQVSMGQTVMKHGAKKVRRLAGGKVIGGFAGSTADAEPSPPLRLPAFAPRPAPALPKAKSRAAAPVARYPRSR